VLREISAHLHLDALTANGCTLGENIAEAPCWNREVIRSAGQPLRPEAGIAVLRGNLAPGGAVIKPSAASPHLLTHRGRAVVFQNIEDFHGRIDDPALAIDETSVMVLQNCGPKGYPGMAEVGNMPLPPKLLKKGVTDMVRISDARMSGTSYGACILHVSPETAVGGPNAMVRAGVPFHGATDDWRAPSFKEEGGRWGSYSQLVLVPHLSGTDLDS
jgi:dihydroxy-acid dehydratase